MFVKITNGQVEKAPYTIGEFRKANPHKSFPKDIPTNILEDAGVFVIKETTHPTVDKKTHTYSWTVEFKGGAWTQVWSTTELPQDRAEQNVRDERNRLLTKSDWTQGKDIADNVSTAWATYRQALRDIPAQEGFPYSITWPQAPHE